MAETEWSDEELHAAVVSYLEMRQQEEANEPYSKSEIRRRLQATSLARRSESSIEYRMQNISYVLQKRGYKRIAGYAPAANVGEATEARLVSMIEDAGGFQVDGGPPGPSTLQDIVSDANLLMGVKAVFGPMTSHVLCFGGRGDPSTKSYYSVPAGAARRAVERPFVLTIGGGKDVRPGSEGRVTNLVRVSLVYGPTALLVGDPKEAKRLAQWPVSIALHDVWRLKGAPHLVDDLGFPDRKILAGAQDGIVHPEDMVARLWDELRNWPVERAAVLLPANFYDSGQPRLFIGKLPSLPSKGGAEEGKRILKLQKSLERDPRLAKAAKQLNVAKHGTPTCESCDFSHGDLAMFDAHHPTPLAVGHRHTLPEHLEILCPTCHRRAHRKSLLDPYSISELREWVAAGRP